MSARSNLVNFSQKKNMTSNSSKPIGLLREHLKLASDDRLPNAYALPDFQPILSTFFDHHFIIIIIIIIITINICRVDSKLSIAPLIVYTIDD